MTVSTHYLGPDAQADAVAGLRTILDTNVWETPLGRRLHHERDDAVAALDRARDQQQAAAAARDLLRSQVRETVAEAGRLRKRQEKTQTALERLQTRSEAQQRQIAELRREAKESRTQAKRAEQALTQVTASRSYRLTDSLRRGMRRVIPKR